MNGRHKQYFRNVLIGNAITGGLVVALPLLLNMYLCFMTLPARQITIVSEDYSGFNFKYSHTLFPKMFYSHSFLHMCFYVFLAFLAGAFLATFTLALSFYINNLIYIYGSVWNCYTVGYD